MARIKWFLINKSGAVTIEYALVIIPFIFSILFIMEICRVTFVISTVDLILAESGSSASILNQNEDSTTHFKRSVDQVADKYPLLLLSNQEVIADVTYCNSFEQLIGNSCSDKTLGSNPLGIYKVEIRYEPVFFMFPKSLFKETIVRKIIFIQEHNLIR